MTLTFGQWVATNPLIVKQITNWWEKQITGDVYIPSTLEFKAFELATSIKLTARMKTKTIFGIVGKHHFTKARNNKLGNYYKIIKEINND